MSNSTDDVPRSDVTEVYTFAFPTRPVLCLEWCLCLPIA